MSQLLVGLVYCGLAIFAFYLIAGAADSVGASLEERKRAFKKIGIFALVFLFSFPFGEAVAQSAGLENWYLEIPTVLTFILAINAGVNEIKQSKITFAVAFAMGMAMGMYSGYQKTNKENALEKRVCLLENPNNPDKCEKAP